MFRRFLVSLLIPIAGLLLTVRADDPETKSQTKSKSGPDTAIEQERLADQFHSFETALLHLAQRLERSTKPEDRERAAVLKEAIKKASEQNIEMKFKALINLLQSSKAISLNEIKEAMDRSKMLADDIRAVLALLMSDNRDAWLKNEQLRIRQVLEFLDKVIRGQKLARAQTESAQVDKAELKRIQEKITKEAEALAKRMGNDKQGDSKEDKNSEKDKGLGDDKGDSKKGGDKKDGDKKNGDKKNAEKKGGDKKDQSSPDGDNKKQSGQKSPGKQQVEQGIKKQKQAESDLDKDKKNDASKAQDQAVQEFEKARKRLEEILRQLREEEKERVLTQLLNRCERMLAMQIEVRDATVAVDKSIAQNPEKRASRNDEQRALQLSDREQEIVREANKAIGVLQAEGSAVAFPEVFIQVRDDMQSVGRRLGKADVGPVTQNIQDDIIATLKEMVQALKKTIQQSQERKNQPSGQGGQPGGPPNQTLIDLLAELKMIRSLQVRVNGRTVTYAHQYQGEQANQPDIQKELFNLAQRQSKILEITNNIAREKNR